MMITSTRARRCWDYVRAGAFCGALLFTGACGESADSGARGPGPLVPSVEAVRSHHGALPLTQRLSGVVRAKNQIAIYPQTTGVVTEILVENGAEVRAGDPLVRLRDTEFRERLKQARANHRVSVAQLQRAEAVAKETRADLERVRSLETGGLASRADLDAAEARAAAAEADIELAKARIDQSLASAEEQEENLARTIIRAPISGSVGGRDAEVGMLATPSTRLFTLGQLDSVRVEIVLTDLMLGYIEAGQRTEVSTATGTASAPLSRISPFLHPVTHSTEAEIDIANPDRLLRPGMFVTVDVFYGESEQATLVPLSALYENPATGNVGVYLTHASLDGDHAEGPGAEASALSEPVSFEFIPTDVIAQGRMEAAVRGVERDTWVVTLGQNLLGGATASARARPVQWDRVERLQRLQREDLMEDVIQKRAEQ